MAETAQDVPEPTVRTVGFDEMLASKEDLIKGSGRVILRDGINDILLQGTWNVSSRGFDSFKRLSSRADILAQRRELFVLGCHGVLCLQGGSDARPLLGQGVIFDEAIPSQRRDDRRDFRVRTHG